MEDLAQVYARSLFEVAVEKDSLESVRDQLGQITDAFDGNRSLQLFFFSPYFSSEEKKAQLASTFEGADPTIINFLALLVENHRTPAIFRIRRHFDVLYSREKRLLAVALTSAQPLDDSEVQQVKQQIADRTGRQIELTAKVDPEILGGLVLRVGNSILDASLKGRLEKVRKEIVKAA